MLRLGLVYRCWPLPVPPAELTTKVRDIVIAKTDVLLAREQLRNTEKTDE